MPTILVGNVAIPQTNNVKYLTDYKLEIHDHIIASKRMYMYVVRRFDALCAGSRSQQFSGVISNPFVLLYNNFYSHIFSNDKQAKLNFMMHN